MNLRWKKPRQNEGSGMSLLNWEKPGEPTPIHLFFFFLEWFADDAVESVTEAEHQKIMDLMIRFSQLEYGESMSSAERQSIKHGRIQLNSIQHEVNDWWNRSSQEERFNIIKNMMTPLEDMEDAAKDEFVSGLIELAQADGSYEDDEERIISWVCNKWGKEVVWDLGVNIDVKGDSTED